MPETPGYPDERSWLCIVMGNVFSDCLLSSARLRETPRRKLFTVRSRKKRSILFSLCIGGLAFGRQTRCAHCANTRDRLVAEARLNQDYSSSYLGWCLPLGSLPRSAAGPITKAGNSNARWLLTQAAQQSGDPSRSPGSVLPSDHSAQTPQRGHGGATARKLVVIFDA